MPGPTSKEASSFSGRTGELLTSSSSSKILPIRAVSPTRRSVAYFCGMWTVLRSSLGHPFLSTRLSITRSLRLLPLKNIPAWKGDFSNYQDLAHIDVSFANSDMTTETEFTDFAHQFRPVAT